MRRRIKPTPRPTKAMITNISIRAFDVIAPTKDVIQVTAAVTIVVTSAVREEIVTAVLVITPPLLSKSHHATNKLTNETKYI